MKTKNLKKIAKYLHYTVLLNGYRDSYIERKSNMLVKLYCSKSNMHQYAIVYDKDEQVLKLILSSNPDALTWNEMFELLSN